MIGNSRSNRGRRCFLKKGVDIVSAPLNEQKVIDFLSKYPTVAGTWEIWKDFGYKYKIDPILAISIANADSSLGNHLKTKNNIGNVGNNDRGDTREYQTLEAGIEAIYKVLNNEYLGDIQIVGDLSNGGRKITGRSPCNTKTEFCYASSPYNWNKNVLATMTYLYEKEINEFYNFRLK